MKFTYATTLLIATGIHSAPNPDALSKFEQLLSDASSKAISALQGYADGANIGVNVQNKVDQIGQVGQEFVNAKKPEFNQWMKQNGYQQKVKDLADDAKKIRNKNRNKTPAQILDALSLKINGATRSNVKNTQLKKNLVQLTKNLKDQAKVAVNGAKDGKMKANALWRKAANRLELEANNQLDRAQAA